MRRQKSGGFSVLKKARNEKRIAPLLPTPSPVRAENVASTPGEGAGRIRGSLGLELGAVARGACKTVEGGGWPLPSRRGERKGGQTVEGWNWRVAEPHTATCDHLLSSSIANTLSLS